MQNTVRVRERSSVILIPPKIHTHACIPRSLSRLRKIDLILSRLDCFTEGCKKDFGARKSANLTQPEQYIRKGRIPDFWDSLFPK